MNREFLKTTEYVQPEVEPSELVFEMGRLVGRPVKVVRTGKKEPEAGWHIAGVHLKNSEKNIENTYVKLFKPNAENPDRGLKKIVPYTVLEKTNPDIRLLWFECDRDYVLYEDADRYYKIGLVVDADLNTGKLRVMLSPEAKDSTAPLETVDRSSVIDKGRRPRKLEHVFRRQLKKARQEEPHHRPGTYDNRIHPRKNLIYYLKTTESGSGHAVGYAADISRQGMLLISQKPIQPDSVFHLETALPARIQGIRSFAFTGVSRWCREDELSKYFHIGFQFLGISKSSGRVVERLVEDYSL